MGTHYSHLTEADRISIQALLQAKLSGRAIFRQLSLSHSSISREIVRGKAQATAVPTSDQAGVAHAHARARRRHAGALRRKLGADLNTPLWRSVLTGLRCHGSPEKMAGDLRTQSNTAHPPDQRSSVSASHETIYCAIYAMPRGTLRTELVSLLRMNHKTRMPRARGQPRFTGLRAMTPIALRPPEVAARIVPGHWEGDLIKGAGNRSSVGTLVERTSRYLMLVKLDSSCASNVLDGFTRRLKTIPPSLRKTLTYDQGTEMASHALLAKQLQIDIFFCDPHSPWQRGSNENANGLVREYLPKGEDLSQYSYQQLTSIEHSTTTG